MRANVSAKLVALAVVFLAMMVSCGSGAEPTDGGLAPETSQRSSAGAVDPNNSEPASTTSVPVESIAPAEDNVCARGLETPLLDATILAGPEEEFLPGHGPISQLAVLQDDRVAVARGGQVEIWNFADPDQPETILDFSKVHSMTEMTDGRLLTGGANPVSWARIYNPLDPEQRPAVHRHESIRVVAIELSDGLIASAGGEEVHIWDPDTPDGDFFPYIEDVQTAYVGHVGEGRHNVSAISELFDGRVMSAAGDLVHIWSRANPGEPEVVYSGHATGDLNVRVSHVAEVAEGRIVSVAGREIHVWSLEDPSAPPVVYDCHGARVSALLILPDGRMASAGGNEVHIWNPIDGGPSHVVTADRERFGDASFNGLGNLADGRIVSSIGREMHIWSP